MGKQRELTALRSQNSRLRASLAHHEDREGQKAATSATTTNTTLQSGVAKPLDAFDEFADWASMMLFKSLLVRRFFCVHLAVLYSWLLFFALVVVFGLTVRTPSRHEHHAIVTITPRGCDV